MPGRIAVVAFRSKYPDVVAILLYSNEKKLARRQTLTWTIVMLRG